MIIIRILLCAPNQKCMLYLILYFYLMRRCEADQMRMRRGPGEDEART